MTTPKASSWRTLTPGQRALLQRMREEGALFSLRPWEMSTVRSLLARGLVRPRLRGRHGGARGGKPDGKPEGLWFLTALGLRTVPPAPSRPAGEEIETAP